MSLVSSADSAVGQQHLAVTQDERAWADSLSSLEQAATTVGRAARWTLTPSERPWDWPLPGKPTVIAHFDRPAQRWLAGHRGIDLAGQERSPVNAVDSGVVSYTGTINGVGVVSVRHASGLLSTYQPVLGAVRAGDRLGRGQRIGTLARQGSHCWPRSCLHLGARSGTDYLDPLSLLQAGEVSLLPTDGR